MPSVLIVDDDPGTLESLVELVSAEGFDTVTATSLAEAKARVESMQPDVVLCDLVLPDGKGIDILEDREPPGPDVILITGHASVETAVEAMRRGVFDYLTKPVDVSRLQALLTSVRRTARLRGEVSELRQELRRLGRFGPLVGASEPMQEVYDLIERVAPTDATVFVLGESGTGKELVAQTVHELSDRSSQGSLVAVNCGAISPNLIESELFGHERGSFTGADRSHRGHFEQASGGTLFLDEVTEMPLEAQVKLLRVLETGSLLRVGGDRLIDVDVRVIAASNRDPREAVDQGTLREDLYYRLNVFPIQLPPLRQRGQDVEAITEHFVEELNRQADSSKTVSAAARVLLASYSWPGNVRELRNVIQRAFILVDRPDGEITPAELPAIGGGAGSALSSRRIEVGMTLDEAKKRLVLGTVEQCSTKKEAAEVLGISIKTLYNHINRHRASSDEESSPGET